jgi:ribosomal protein L18E
MESLEIRKGEQRMIKMEKIGRTAAKDDLIIVTGAGGFIGGSLIRAA